MTASLSLTLLLLTPFPLLAQTPPSQPARPTTVRFQPPPPPPLGLPSQGRNFGAASRGDCRRYQGLTVLVPSVKTGAQTVPWGQTLSDRPTWWVHAPQGLQAGVVLELTLDRGPNSPTSERSQQRWTAADTPTGTFALQPDRALTLQPQQPHRWTLSVFCDPENPDRPLQLQGYIQKAVLTGDRQRQLDRQLSQAPTPLARAQALAHFGIWYDALTELGLQHPATQPAWQALLRQGNLSPIDSAIVPCCQASK